MLHVDRDLVPVNPKMRAVVLTASAILGVGLVLGQEIRCIKAKRSQVQGLGHLVRPTERLGHQVKDLVRAQLREVRPVRPFQC